MAILAIAGESGHTASWKWLEVALRINVHMQVWRCSGATNNKHLYVDISPKSSFWSVFFLPPPCPSLSVCDTVFYHVSCYSSWLAATKKTRALLPMTHQYTVVQWYNNRIGNSVKNTLGFESVSSRGLFVAFGLLAILPLAVAPCRLTETPYILHECVLKLYSIHLQVQMDSHRCYNDISA